MSATSESLARFLAKHDGLDPECRMAHAYGQMNTSIGPLLHVRENPPQQVWELYLPLAALILKFLADEAE